LLDYETLQKTKIFGEQTAAARNDVIAKRIVGRLFQNLSGRPEDWTVSGPCHLYTRVQALTTQINLARTAPAQLVVFIEKQAGESMTPSPSEERNWSQKGPAPCALVVKGQSILLRT